MPRLLLQPVQLFLAALAFFVCSLAQASPFLVTIDTSSLAGTSATLAFDFIGDQNNVATIRQLQAATVPGTQQAIGDVTGDATSGLAFSTAGSFFNEFIVDVTLGNLIVFELELSGNGPTAGGAPDAFSLMLLDALAGVPLFPTSDPTGSDALFRLDIDGSGTGALDIFSADGVFVSVEPLQQQEVPEPSTLLLAVPLLLFLVVRHSKRALAVCSAFCLLTAGATFHAQAQENLGDQVTIAKSGAVLNRVSNTYDYIVTVTNTSASAIVGPLTLGIRDVGGPEVAVYNPSGFDENDYPQVTAALDFGALKPGASVKVPVRFVNPRGVAIAYTVTAHGTVLAAQDSVTLQVRTFFYSGNEDSPAGEPAGAGIALRIGGVTLGVTDSAGEATITVPASVDSISAQRAPTTVGSALLELVPGQTNSVDIIVTDDGNVYADSAPRVDEVRQLLLPSTFTAFTGRFTDPRGTAIKLARLGSVDRYDSIGTPLGSLDAMFTLHSDGTFRPTDVAALRNLLNAQSDRITLAVTGYDSADKLHAGDIVFHMGRNAVVGRLAAPTSFPGLRLSGVRVVGKILNTDILVATVTDANGRFAFPALPNGNLSIAVETLQNAQYYYGSGVFTLTGAADLVVPLASAAGSQGAGQSMNQSINLKAPAATARAPGTKVGVNARREEDLRNTTPVPLPDLGAGKVAPGALAAAATSASVAVTAGAQNVASTQSAKLTVPKGTSKVTLTYVVGTAEYPQYVTQQSIYNDVWGIRLFGGAQGTQLFDITHQVNSQLTQNPVWLANGTTGVIERSFDVKALAKDADIEVTLTAFATNIGDSQLPTSVNATVTAGNSLSIDSVATDADAWVANNDKSYYSIPASGSRNTFHRKLTLTITKPAGATITNLKVELLGANGDATVLDTAPNADVVLVGDTKVRTVVTFKPDASTVNGVPPPTNVHQYRFTLEAKDAEGNELTAEKIESNKHPLWRMPAGFARYSTRDAGGDDWASRRTYLWMDQHRNLLRAINDVSGEHGKDLSHQTHARGNDIDMYHFYTFPGADANNGTSNYTQLVARVKDLPKQNSTNPQEQAAGVAAAAQVQAWVLGSRTGIDNLAANADVREVGYIQGGPAAVAGISGANWGETLLRTGTVTVNGAAYVVVQGTWTNAKYRAWPGHHHHVHVTLAPDL